MSAVKVIYLKPTDTCNLDCSFCFTSGSKGANNVWDRESSAQWITELIDQFPDDEFHIELHGGEPFYRPIDEHWEFIEHLYNANSHRWGRISVGTITNLVYKLSDDHLHFFREVLGNRLATSWDPIHRFKTQKMYEFWVSNLHLLKQHGMSLKLCVTVTDEIMKYDPDQLLDLWEHFGVDEVALERLTSDGNAVENPHIFPDNRDIDRFYYDLYFAYKRRNPSFVIGTLEAIEEKFYTNEFKVDMNCRNCEQHLFTLGADGAIGGCANGAQVESKNSIDEDVGEFLVGEGRLSRISKELDYDPRCFSCDLFDVCGGECHRLVWQGDECPGLKHLLRYFKYGDHPPETLRPSNMIPVVQM